MTETFEEFRKSFSYGSRSDLNFKFLKSLTNDAAAEFFRQLLDELGDAYDHGTVDPLIDLAIEWQVRAYTPGPDADRPWVYEAGPFERPAKPVSQLRIALMTSSGHFVRGDDPAPLGIAGMTQQEAENRITEFLREKPALSRIPAHTPHDELAVRHGGYDVSSAEADPGVTFPLAALREFEAEGLIGELHDTAFSFPGAAAQRRIINESAPEWAEMMTEEGVEAVLLVPV